MQKQAEWILCPVCGNKTRDRTRYDTVFIPKSENAVKVYEQQHAINKDHTLGTYYITKEYFDTSMKGFEVLPGDIIVSCAGTIGETYIMPETIECGIINQALMRITVVPSIDKRFFLYYFDSQLKNRAKDGNGMAITNIPPFDVLKNLYFPLPPLAEQKRIVEKIEQAFSVLDTIDELQAQYADNLTVLKSKLIDLAIRGKLTEQLPEDGTAEELYQQIQAEKQALIQSGKIKKEKPLPEIAEDEIPFEIPDNWKWIRWGEIVNIVSARRVHQSDWRKTGVPFYRAREIAKLAEDGFVNNELYISEELFAEFSKTGVPHENDLMVSAVGTLGKTYVVKSSDRFYYKDASVLCFENFGGINPYYLAFVMKTEMMRQQVESNSGGTTVDTLTMIRMIKYLMPLPPLAEQKRIVAKLDAVLKMIEK